MTGSLQAATNNAEWCDFFCRLHGHPGQFHPGYWVNAGPVPALYPNFVTLGLAEVEMQTRQIAAITADAPSRPFAVKDSFAKLALQPYGFEVLFSAEWYNYRAPPVPSRGAIGHDGWKTLRAPRSLGDWELAWREAEGHHSLWPRPFFPPALLDDGRALVLANCAGSTVRGGAIIFRTQGTMGITNFFCASGDRRQLFSSCLDTLAGLYPDHDITGYEEAGFAAAMGIGGLVSSGELRVWIKIPSGIASPDDARGSG